MKFTKLVVLAAVAVCAVSALAAATASALPEFLPTNTKAKFTSTSGPGTLFSGGGNVECTSDTNEGQILSATHFDVLILFKGCKAFGFANCTTAGQPSGTIHITGLGLLGFIKKTAPLDVGASIEITGLNAKLEEKSPAEFSCAGGLAKIAIRGAAIGLIEPLNTSSTTGKLGYKAPGGKQEFTKFEGGAELTFESSKNGGAFEKAAEETTDTITFAEAISTDG
jgi:hypothetical protein